MSIGLEQKQNKTREFIRTELFERTCRINVTGFGWHFVHTPEKRVSFVR